MFRIQFCNCFTRLMSACVCVCERCREKKIEGTDHFSKIQTIFTSNKLKNKRKKKQKNYETLHIIRIEMQFVFTVI